MWVKSTNGWCAHSIHPLTEMALSPPGPLIWLQRSDFWSRIVQHQSLILYVWADNRGNPTVRNQINTPGVLHNNPFSAFCFVLFCFFKSPHVKMEVVNRIRPDSSEINSFGLTSQNWKMDWKHPNQCFHSEKLVNTSDLTMAIIWLLPVIHHGHIPAMLM